MDDLSVVVTEKTWVPNLDRNIRLVKERCRCIVSSLPYDLPNFLITEHYQSIEPVVRV
jgi:hypothetical protein